MIFFLEHDGEVIAVQPYVDGYYPIKTSRTAKELNDLPPDVVESALVGSMFGWSCPGAALALKWSEQND
jgi:hypothetical protein